MERTPRSVWRSLLIIPFDNRLCELERCISRIPIAAWALMGTIALCCNPLIGYYVRRTVAESSAFIVLTLILLFSFFLITDIDGRLCNCRSNNRVHIAVCRCVGGALIWRSCPASRFGRTRSADLHSAQAASAMSVPREQVIGPPKQISR